MHSKDKKVYYKRRCSLLLRVVGYTIFLLIMAPVAKVSDELMVFLSDVTTASVVTTE